MTIKAIKKIYVFFFSVFLMSLFCMASASAASPPNSAASPEEIPYESYTYWEDYNPAAKTLVYCKPMYTVESVITLQSLGGSDDSQLADICNDENGFTYILDSGLSKIYILNKEYKLQSVIEELTRQGDLLYFEKARGIFVKDGKIYIADTENARVLVINSTGTITDVLLLPDSELIPAGFDFKPLKVAVDSEGYTYIVSDGSYYGALLYSPEMKFLGFYGANNVKASVLDALSNLWKRLFSNDRKRAADVLALPFQFTDLAIGPQNFVYTVTGKTEMQENQTGQVSMLNPGGRNVLDAEAFNFGDLYVGSLRRQRQTQDLAGICVDADGFFYVIDTTYGRVFWYDKKCNLLSVFGGSFGAGNQKGTFSQANSITLNGTDVIIGDADKNSATIFKITGYGNLVREMQTLTLNGMPEQTLEGWKQALALDRNNQMAYKGAAKAYFILGDFKKAVEYAKTGADRKLYSDAYKKRLNAFLEEHFTLMFIGAVLLGGLLIFGFAYKKKHAIRLIKSEKARTLMSSVFHPFESFQAVREKGRGSALFAAVILMLWYIFSVLSETSGGFANTVFDSSNYNSVYVLMSTVGLILLWTITNWLVSSLLGGVGKIKDIFVVSGYSLIPIVFSIILKLIFSFVLAPDEMIFLEIFAVFCLLYSFFMLMAGISKIHDYEFGKFFTTSLLSVVGMLIIVFLLFLIFLLAQQVFGWASTLFIEIRYR